MKKNIILLVLGLVSGIQSYAQMHSSDTAQLKLMVEKYCRSVNIPDSTIAGSIWEKSSQVAFISPRGHEIGWKNINKNIYHFFWDYFTESHLKSVDEIYAVYGDIAIVDFYWVFDAVLKADHSLIQNKGRETQIWKRKGEEWRLVHVHYSAMP